MGSLKHTALRLGALSVRAGAIAVSGRIGLYLAFGAIFFLLSLVAVLALTQCRLEERDHRRGIGSGVRVRVCEFGYGL